MPLPAHALRAGLSLSQDVAHGPDIPGLYSVYATTDECNRVVHITRALFLNADIKTSETEEGRSLGFNRHCCEVSGPIDQSNVATEHERGSETATWLQFWDLAVPQANPPHA
jgi:hypothetical protein